MNVYTLVMRIEADDEISPKQIKAELYEAVEDVPFAFDITAIRDQA